MYATRALALHDAETFRERLLTHGWTDDAMKAGT